MLHSYCCHFLHLFFQLLSTNLFFCSDEEGWANPVLIQFHVFSLSLAVSWVYKGENVSVKRQVQLWTIAVVIVFKRFVLVSIYVNIPLPWQLMLERTEQLLTEAQWAFPWQWSLSWTVSPLAAALLSPPPRTQHPTTPLHTHNPHPKPPPLTPFTRRKHCNLIIGVI